MVTDDDRIKLLDFGLAKALSSGGAETGDAKNPEEFGTTAYMAPELLSNAGADPHPRSEIFSFGLILYQMLSGRHAFGAARREGRSDAIRSKDPRGLPAKASGTLASIVYRCLQKSPERRFESMQDLLLALRKCRGNALPGSAPAHSAAPDEADHGKEIAEIHAMPVRRSVELRKIRAAIRRIGHENIARSRQACAELERLIDGRTSPATRAAALSDLKDLILDIGDFGGNGNMMPSSVREMRKMVLELIKLLTEGHLSQCFERHDLEFLDLYGMNFASLQLTGLSFKSSLLVEANFQASILVQAAFTAAFVRNANFAGADLSGADLTDADWFNAVALTKTQLESVRRDTLMACPPNIQAMHRYLKARYKLPFDSWPGRVQEQLNAAWKEYLRPEGLRDIVAGWR